tara:strand:+ start:38 stop:220 length:183 start_codon:yes stop_codon:yes gene_type:complete
MLEDLLVDLKSFFYSLGIISVAIIGMLILPKKASLWLGKFPIALVITFALIIFSAIQAFN